MADLDALRQPVIVDVVARAEPIDQLGKSANQTSKEIQATTNQLSTFLTLTQRNIESTLNDIESIKNRIEGTKIDIKDKQNEIELLNSQIKSLESLQSAKNIQEVVDIITLLGTRGRGGASGSLVADLAADLDPSVLKDLFLQFRDINRAAALIDKQRDQLKFLAQNITVENDGSVRASTEEERILRLQEIAELQKEINALTTIIDERGDDILARTEPLLSEKFKLQEAIEENKQIIQEKENLINKEEILLQKEQDLLQKLKEDEKEIINQLKDSDIQLDFQISPDSQQGLQDQIDLFDNGGSAAIAYADANSMVVDTLNDMVNPFQIHREALEETKSVSVDLADSTVETVNQLEKENNVVGNLNPSLVNLATVNQNVANTQGEVVEQVEGTAEAFDNGAQGAVQFAEETQNASETLNALGVFAADIAANINDAFSDLIFNALKGNIESFGDLWEDTLDTMLQTFSQFVSTIVSNPIRIALDTFLRGSGGGGIGSLLGGIGGGLGNSFTALGGLFGIGGGLTTLAPAAGLPIGIGALVPTSVGFFGNLTSAIPAIGLIAAAVTTAFSVISSLLKKTPRLDLDFDQLRDDAGKSIGVAAQVADFLDPDVFLNEIFNTSVSRQAGLGLQGGAGKVIQEKLAEVIGEVQDIINTLPFELEA